MLHVIQHGVLLVYDAARSPDMLHVIQHSVVLGTDYTVHTIFGVICMVSKYYIFKQEKLNPGKGNSWQKLF